MLGLDAVGVVAVGGATGQPSGRGGAVAGAVTSRSVSPAPSRAFCGVVVAARTSAGGTGNRFAGGGIRTAGRGVRVAVAVRRRIHDVVVGVGVDLLGAAVTWRISHDVMSRSLRTRDEEL